MQRSHHGDSTQELARTYTFVRHELAGKQLNLYAMQPDGIAELVRQGKLAGSVAQQEAPPLVTSEGSALVRLLDSPTAGRELFTHWAHFEKIAGE